MPNSLIKTSLMLVLMGLLGCDEKKPENKIVPPIENIPLEKDTVTLNGTWALTCYFDSIIEYKKIAKYRNQSPPKFARLIEIKNDSLFSHGSLFDEGFKFNISSDTLVKFERFEGPWHLIKKPGQLWLVKQKIDRWPDSTIYVYKKRNDLNSLIDHKTDVRKTTKGIIKYFHEKLFAGTYSNIKSGETVELKANEEIKGLRDYDRYEVGDHFDRHPLKQLDVITLLKGKKWDWWNWRISSDTLILTKITGELKTHDDWRMTKDKVVLVKKSK